MNNKYVLAREEVRPGTPEEYIFVCNSRLKNALYLPNIAKTPHPAQTMRLIQTDPDPSRTPLGDTKIPDPTNTTKTCIEADYTYSSEKCNFCEDSNGLVTLFFFSIFIIVAFSVIQNT